jgi:predicted aldo/keto reductase-like oxidoreductase
MTKSLNQSLESMNTSYVDLYFLHGVSYPDEADKQIKAWADEAKTQDKIRFFGFSTHSNMEDCLLGAAKLGWIDGIMLTYNFRVMHPDRMNCQIRFRRLGASLFQCQIIQGFVKSDFRIFPTIYVHDDQIT